MKSERIIKKFMMICYAIFCMIAIIGCRSEQKVNLTRLSNSITKAINYLEVMQNESGSFDGYHFLLLDPNNRTKDDPMGYTIYITWNLCALSDLPEIKKIITKAAMYIQSRKIEINGMNMWRWSEDFPCDADETALAGIILKKLNYSLPIGIKEFMNEDGSFNTWYGKSKEKIDVLVQLNVYSYFQMEGENNQKEFQTLIEKFVNKQLESNYYQHYREAFLYHLASSGNVALLTKNKLLFNKLKKMINFSISKSVTRNSYLGYFLVKANLLPNIQQKLVNSLLDNQLDDGSWKIEDTYLSPYKTTERRGYGSNCTTTSYAIKFLQAYRNYLKDERSAMNDDINNKR